MADINTLIAAGPHTQGIDVRGNALANSSIQGQAKRNDLIDIGIAQAPIIQQRATTKYEQEQRVQERGALFQASNEFVRAWESGGKDAALNIIARFPDEGRLGEIKQNTIAALNSPDPNDDQEVLRQAQMFVQVGTDEGFFEQQTQTAPTKRTEVTPEGKFEFMVNSDQSEVPNSRYKVDEVGGADAKPRYETINNVPRWIEGPDKGKEVFPGVEISPETERNLTNEAGVRKEFNGLLGDYNKVSDAFAKIKASVSNPSPAGDLSLVFQFMKMLDPGSTVRQSEFDTAEGARAELQRAEESGGIVPNFIWGAINKLSTGQILLENQRNDFVNRSNKLYEASRSQAQKTADAYTIIAKSANMPVESIIANFLAQGNQEDIPLPEGYTEIP